MLRSFVFLLFLFLSLYAQTDKELLASANSYAKSSSKTDQFRAYDNYKNLYLRALVNNNAYLKKSALEGIVKTGKRLHIDISRYEKELSRTRKFQKSKKQKITIQSLHKLKSVHWKAGRLVLQFDKKLNNKEINYFTLYDKKKRKYKYVFDIHASMLTKSQRLYRNGIERIQLAQYKPKTLRLVIENSKKIALHFKKDRDRLSILMQTTSLKPKTIVHKIKKPSQKFAGVVSKHKTIVIDAGHGGKDPGAVGYRHYREKVVVLQIAKELRKILKARGYRVYMTRDRDRFIRLRNRTKFANKKHADIFVSIHANAVSKKDAKKAEGIECYFLSPSRSRRAKRVAEMENAADLEDMNFYARESLLSIINSHNIIAANKLAIDMQRGALASLKKHYKNVKDAGVREGPFWVLVGAQMPAVLVEVGFITHPKEASRLVNRRYQHTMAVGLANGIERYFMNN